MCEARVLVYCGTNIQQWAFTQINRWDGEEGAKGSVSNYPLILSVILLSYYPICFRGFDWINLPFGGVHWENLSYYPTRFGESDRINFPFKRGGVSKSLSYYPIASRRESDRLSSLFGRFKGKFILLSYRPIRSRGLDKINSPFGRPKGKVYPISLLPYLFQGSRYDKTSLLGGDGVPKGKFIRLSYCTGFGAGVHSSQFILLSCFPSCLQGVCIERMMMKPPNPLLAGGGRGRRWESLSCYPIILSVFRGLIG